MTENDETTDQIEMLIGTIMRRVWMDEDGNVHSEIVPRTEWASDQDDAA
jgi:hypothetical protein